ncbi:thioredoxin domain-containing protein [Candidatus Tisiphia endosymbiont of Sialis lutaria]|uniref:thioredoxin domain-containing protein n=1 Tax=Candidatus Tisiphia endosymbiont of Sialis lutaria TaxID=2029164 RepID=UPI00312C96A6
MHTIIIILVSLLLISCSEESDTSNNKNKLADNKAEVSQEKAPSEENNDIVNSGKLGSRSDGATPISNRRATSDDVTNFSSIDYNPANDKLDIIVDDQEVEQQDSTISTDTEKPLETTKNSTVESVDGKTDVQVVSPKQISYKPTFNVSQNDIILGNIEANVVVVEYFSPTCPHCAYYHDTILPKLKKKYIDTNKITYIIREFIGNKQDLDAAILQRCQNNKDSFLKFQSVILSQQDKWGVSNRYRELLTNIAQIGGVSAETYAKCLNDNQIVETLLANTNLAASAPNFVGTPAFFVNSIQTNGYDLQTLSKEIDKALSSSTTHPIK